MKKFLKIFGILILLLLIVIISLPYFFKDKIAEEIKTAANDNMNALVEFEDISLSLISNFPNLSLDLDNFSITGLEEFEGVKLADIAAIEATIDLASLFGDQINIKRIAIVSPTLDVRVLENGSANYDIAKASEEEVEEESGESSAFNIQLKEYSITNANLIYDDKSMPFYMDLKNLNHNGNGDFTQDLFVLATNTDIESIDMVYDGSSYIKKASAGLKADLDMDMANMKFVFKENEIRFNELLLAFDGWLEMPGDDISMDITYAATKTDFRHLLSMVPAEFASDLGGVDVAGKMGFDGFVKGTYNDASLPGFGLNLSVDNGRFQYPDLPKSVDNIQVQASIDASDGNDYDKMKIDVPKFYMEMADNPIDIALKLRTPMSDPEIDCDVVAKIVMENLKDVVPLEKGDELTGSINADMGFHGKMSAIENEEYENFDAHGQMIVQQIAYKSDSLDYDVNVDVAYFNFSPQFLELSQFKAGVGKSDFSAAGKIDNYMAYALRDEMLQGTFSISSNLMDLNEFMSDDEDAATTEGQEEESEMSVVEIPGNIDFTINADFKKMLYGDMEMDNTRGQIRVKDHVASLKGFTMDILEGKVIADGSYSTESPEKPLMDFDFNIQNMDIQKSASTFNTIEKLAPIAKNSTGKFSTQLNLVAELDGKMEPISESIEGRGSLQTSKVVVSGVKFVDKIAAALQMEDLAKLDVQDVNLSYTITEGKAIVEPFDVKIDGMPATIEGHTTLLTQEIDYTAKMDVPFEKISGNLANQASGLMDQLNSQLGTNLSGGDKVPVNIRITGTMDNPKIGTSYGDVAKGAVEDIKEQVIEEVKEQVEEKIEEVKDDAIEKAREEADKVMEDAQKQADKLLADAKKTADKLKNDAYKEADKVEGSYANVFEKAGKKVLADGMRKEADKAHTKAMNEAKKQSDKILADAKKRGDALIDKAE